VRRLLAGSRTLTKDETMSIITISRGTFSGGMAIAECVAEHLGYQCISREVLIDAAQKYGVSPEALNEAIVRPPSFLQRMGRHRDAYVAFFRATLCDWALRDNLVYHGHAGHFLLAGIRHVLHARVVAPMEFRIAGAMKRMSGTREDAIAYIGRIDGERARWTQALYGVSWEDPHYYDIVLNLMNMSLDTACEVIVQMIGRPEFTTTPESQEAMQALAIKSKILAALAADPRTADASVELLVDGDTVTIEGWARLQGTLDAIPEIAGSVEGVKQVDCRVVVRSGFPI
jgi:cytidylate kinase